MSSEPEISRRCTACGASVRHQAAFCAQCGNPIAQTTATVTNVSDTIIDTAPTQAVESVSQAPIRKVPEDGVRARVEKWRKVSSVVLDQAAYDPSVRFLLVAAGLFLLFLVLLILSKVIG